ncbi:MAG: addiction module protein [Planctomycetaceae bacterium]|nr:addiction module protein [Planctomycetaceae bacterium]
MSAAADFPIGKLSLAEKLLLMERLWEDMSRTPSSLPVPDWHGEVLAQRQARVDAGQAEWVDWEVAKERLRRRMT